MKPIPSSQKNHNNPTNNNEYQERIESLILQLSKKEAEQNSKRQKCTLFATEIKFHQDEITKLRSQVNSTMEELHLIDDVIEELTKKKDRLVLMMNKSSHGNNNNIRKRGSEGEDDNDDEFFMHTQYAQNMTQLERMEGSHNDVICNEEGKNDEEKKNDDNNNNIMSTKSNSFSSNGTIMKKNSKLQSIQTLPIIHRDGDGRNDNTKCKNGIADGTFNNDNHDNHNRIRWTSQQYDDNYDDIEEFYDDDEHEPPPYLFDKENCNNYDDDHNHHNDYEGDDQNCNNHTMTVATTDNTITTARKHDEPTTNCSSFSNQLNKSNQGQNSNTIDNYFQKPALTSSIFPPSVQQELNMTSSSTTVSGAAAAAASYNNRNSHINTTTSSSTSSLSFRNQQNHRQLRPQSENNRPSAEQRNEQYLQKLSSDNFPWSNFIIDLLHNTFKIRNFRDHQKQIINCTLSGDDVFVIMRTGGYVVR